MNIHTLMTQFAQFEHAKIGRGPKHPTEPNVSLHTEVNTFLESYPFLRNDTGYIDFLECYAGASIFNQNSPFTVDILGFAGNSISTHMFEMEESVIDEEGFLMFGYLMLDDKSLGQHQISFGFDATHHRLPGVYQYVSQVDAQWDWYCATFLEWLDKLLHQCKQFGG